MKKRLIHMTGILFAVILIWGMLPEKAEGYTKYLTRVEANYSGGSVLKGSTYNLNDVTVKAYYSDGTWEFVTGYTVSTMYISYTGTNTITAYYGGMSDNFYVIGVDQPVISYYTVYFVTDGGSYVSPIYSVKQGDTIVLPDAPYRYGYRFRGWYTSSSLTTLFSEETPITSTTYIYAKWEPRAKIVGNTISYGISNGSVSATVSAYLAGQKYGANVDLDVAGIENSKIVEAVKKIAITDKFIAFEFNMEDYVYSDSNPLPVTITIPSNFIASKCAVYYTTNKETIMGKMKGALIGNSAYQFYAYEPGAYILVECLDQTPPEVPSGNSPYITIEPLEDPVTVDSETALIVLFHDYPGKESDVKLTWSSSNYNVAEVDNKGIVYAYKKGEATITVKSADGKFKATRKIRVVADDTIASRIKTNVSSKTIGKGKSFQIKTTVYPAAASSYVVYSSSKKSVATVSAGGKVYGKKKGSCYIYVKTVDGSNLTKKIRITVR